ncbi:MAG: cobalamin-binding protein [Candidatus Undinarchaeales archaeon]|jgi:iron complex transport system substrate-binding protein|nr:cobalamin-binding protein [Candidatus Undinarchaeales archaeon]MDP7494141.1 cobalamin-binding protein [Candidatus Undinarchaeales archaeon]
MTKGNAFINHHYPGERIISLKATLIVALLLTVALFAGCTSGDGPATPSGEQGDVRIISISPGTTEIVFALGMGDKMVGVTTYCNYPPAALEVEKVGDVLNPSVERIVSLKPTLVLGIVDQSAVAERLTPHGINVHLMNATSLDGVMDEMATIARLTGAGEEGERIVADLRGRIAAVRERTTTLDETARPTVFVEVWDEPLMSAGPGTFTHDVVISAGGRPALDLTMPWPNVDAEAVIVAKPQVVLLTHTNRTIEHLRARPGWNAIPAVKDERVYLIDPDAVSRPGPRIVDAVEEVADRLHGNG